MEYKCHFAFFPKQVRLRRGHQGPAPAHLPPANGGQRVHQRRERRKRKRRQQETQAAAAAKLGRRRRRRRERNQGELSADELFVRSVPVQLPRLYECTSKFWNMSLTCAFLGGGGWRSFILCLRTAHAVRTTTASDYCLIQFGGRKGRERECGCSFVPSEEARIRPRRHQFPANSVWTGGHYPPLSMILSYGTIKPYGSTFL